MKFIIDENELFTLTPIQEKIVQHHINSDNFDADMKRRVKWVIMHCYEQCFDLLKKEWDQKLIASGVKALPVDPEEYAKLVFAQPDYKDRKARDAEVEAKLANLGA